MNLYIYLDIANRYAESISSCTKVHVGAIILDEDKNIVSIGANRAVPNSCISHGCLRVEKYGNNNKTHRNPEDCRAIHAELDAICKAKTNLKGCTMYVTRYPCEACARAIVSAKFKGVVYGRKQAISNATKEIFESAHLPVYHVEDWIEDDVLN